MTDSGTENSKDRSSRVVVVEPSTIIARAVLEAAERCGLQCEVVGNFTSAVSAITSEKPFAVFSSHEIEELSGLSLFAALQASPEHRVIPFAIMTSNPTPLMEAQPYPLLIKSPDMTDSIATLLESLGHENDESVKLEIKNAFAGKRVLIAEDTASMRRLLSHKLHMAGAEISVADDGLEAGVLGLASKYDLIVLDIEMPRLDGRDAVRILREGGVQVPIVALTAHDDPLTIESLIRDHKFSDVVSKKDAVPSLVRSFSVWTQLQDSSDRPSAA